ncbi:MAG: efflux RND transporter periplasmic adaptor subunit [Reichenbachiella sp.]|uniref:efflux RND transporter periplasmic adaptor subunit n=1 Tax=Reichenbachiella sp. TaxID=2184521 RepID=UPI0032653BE8
MNKLYILIVLTIPIGFLSCETHKEHHQPASKFLVTSPMRQDTLVTRDYVCQIHSVQHIELRALERGYLEKIFVDEGQFVKKGQLMFQIMPRLYQAELERAEAETNYAKIEYENTRRLTESNVVAPNELALAKAKLDKAKAELSLAQVHLDFTQVRAPFDGIIDHFHVRLGSLVEEGHMLTTLSDNHEMWVYFNVPEAEYLDYKVKAKSDSVMNVRLALANNKAFEFPGKVTAIEADFNNETGNIAFRATFPNPKGLLRHGETGNVLVDTPLKNALLIPQKATFEILDRKYVYVIGDDQVAHSRQITVAAELPHLYVLKAGLKDTDIILLEGLRKVRDGDKIGSEFIAPKVALADLQLHAE